MEIKRVLILIIFCITMAFATNGAYAYDYSKITTDKKITTALVKLEKINRKDVLSILAGNNAIKKPITIQFKDFSLLGYGDCEALTVKKGKKLEIYINEEHKGASPECIACLIAHEAQHHTFTSSKGEELRAWISEVQAWNEFLKTNKELSKSTEPLARRENYVIKIQNKSGTIGIQKLIAANPVYKGLN